MQEAMRVEDGSVRFPDLAAQTTSADTYRHPGLQLSRSKTTLIEPPANYQVRTIRTSQVRGSPTFDRMPPS